MVPFELVKEYLPEHFDKYGGGKVRDAFYLFNLYQAYVYRGDDHKHLYGTCFLSMDKIQELTGLRRDRQAELNKILIEHGMLNVVKVMYNGRLKNLYIPMLPESAEQKRISEMIGR